MFQEVTAVTIDLRGFTIFLSEVFNKSEEEAGNEISFLKEYLQNAINIAKWCANDESAQLNYITTGDGAIIMFKGDHNKIRGYLYSIILKNKIDEILKNKEIRYGIGIGSGKAYALYPDRRINILSNAINTSAKLEKMTKFFVGTELLITNETFEGVIEYFNKDILQRNGFKNYKSIREATKNYELHGYTEQALQLRSTMNNLNENLFFRYIAKVNIDGSNNERLLYSYSDSLFKVNKTAFWTNNKDKIDIIVNKKYLKEIESFFT